MSTTTMTERAQILTVDRPFRPSGAEAPTATKGGLAAGVLRQVLAKIEERMGAGFALADLAGLANLSEGHFSRAFKRSVGLPPHRYLLHRRVCAATRLLGNDTLTLTGIALTCGFFDQSQFTRQFAAMSGITPGAHRRSLRSQRAIVASSEMPSTSCQLEKPGGCGSVSMALPREAQIEVATHLPLQGNQREPKGAVAPAIAGADATAGRAASTRPSCRGGLAPAALRRVREHIDDHLGHTVDLRELAQQAGVSACHFSRAFRQSVGESPHRYLVMRRIDAAIARVRDTDQPLGEIGLEVGFSDHSHFTRVFRTIVGETPYTFRRAHR
ncbi:hypothetical protein BH11PSE9_BH11PSE9_17060 [soil metagenome]